MINAKGWISLDEISKHVIKLLQERHIFLNDQYFSQRARNGNLTAIKVKRNNKRTGMKGINKAHYSYFLLGNPNCPWMITSKVADNLIDCAIEACSEHHFKQLIRGL